MKKTGLLVLILALVMSLFVTAMADTITSGDSRATSVQLKGNYTNTTSGEPVVEIPEVWHIDVAVSPLIWDVTKTTSTGGTKTYTWDVDNTKYSDPTTTTGDTSYSLTIEPANKRVLITNKGNVIVSCGASVTPANTELGSFLDGRIYADPPRGNLDASSPEERSGNVLVSIDTSSITVDGTTLSGLSTGVYEIGTLIVRFNKEGLVPVPEN